MPQRVRAQSLARGGIIQEASNNGLDGPPRQSLPYRIEEQGLTVRLSIERGHNPLYRFIGFDRIIGLNNADVDSETARFRVIETLTNDPRIASVRRISFEAVADNLQIDADLEVRGFSQGVSVRAIGVT